MSLLAMDGLTPAVAAWICGENQGSVDHRQDAGHQHDAELDGESQRGIAVEPLGHRDRAAARAAARRGPARARTG